VNFEERARELIDVDARNLWKSFKDGLLQACDEVCGKKRGRNDRGNTWWWNEEVKEVISRKKAAYKDLCKNSSKENDVHYKRMKTEAKKVVRRAMKKETEQLFNELYDKPANVFKVLKVMKREGKDVGGGKCLRGKDGRLSFSEVDRGKIWKDHMEEIMNVENEWDHRTEVDVVEGPIEKLPVEEMVKAIRAMKLGKTAGPSEVSTEMIIASAEIRVGVMMELCQNVLDGKGIPEE